MKAFLCSLRWFQWLKFSISGNHISKSSRAKWNRDSEPKKTVLCYVSVTFKQVTELSESLYEGHRIIVLNAQGYYESYKKCI